MRTSVGGRHRRVRLRVNPHEQTRAMGACLPGARAGPRADAGSRRSWQVVHSSEPRTRSGTRRPAAALCCLTPSWC